MRLDSRTAAALSLSGLLTVTGLATPSSPRSATRTCPIPSGATPSCRAHREFPMGDASKSARYRHQVADAAVDALLEAIDRLGSGTSMPEALDYRRPEIEGRLERLM